MNSIELFAGIGGISLAAEWAGITTKAFCEREPFCQKVLKKHWPNTPIFDDVRTLNRKVLEENGVIEPGGTVDIISGGYPCQPFSLAGERKGENDDRHLWPEVKRLLQEIRPTWFVGENVVGHVTLGLDLVLYDLENIGYTWQPFVIPAAAIGAQHRRERVFIIAHSNNLDKQRIYMENSKETVRREENKREWCEDRFRINMDNSLDITKETSRTLQRNIESYVCRKLDGVSNKLDKSRLKALGNAVVPQQIYPIFKAIMEIEGVMNECIQHKGK